MAHCCREGCRRWRPTLIIRLAKLGLTVDGEWFCSNGCVEADAVRRLRDAPRRDLTPRAPALRLGAVLLHQGVVTLRQLSEALEAHAPAACGSVRSSDASDTRRGRSCSGRALRAERHQLSGDDRSCSGANRRRAD
jgi:hypothetical protein